MSDAFLLKLCAVHSLGFAAFHAMFWKLFRWKEDLKRTSVATRAIVQIANLRLIYLFVAVAALCLAFPEELLGTPMGTAILLGMSLFWASRTLEQFVFLPYNTPLVHTLTVLFITGAVLFAVPALRS